MKCFVHLCNVLRKQMSCEILPKTITKNNAHMNNADIFNAMCSEEHLFELNLSLIKTEGWQEYIMFQFLTQVRRFILKTNQLLKLSFHQT